MDFDKTIVIEQKDKWVIERNEDFIEMPELGQETVKGVRVTPGFNPERRPDVRPRRIEISKYHGDAEAVIRTIVPNIIEREGTCTVCKDARAKLVEKGIVKGEGPPTTISTPAQEKKSKALLTMRPRTFIEQVRKNRPRFRDLF